MVNTHKHTWKYVNNFGHLQTIYSISMRWGSQHTLKSTWKFSSFKTFKRPNKTFLQNPKNNCTKKLTIYRYEKYQKWDKYAWHILTESMYIVTYTFQAFIECSFKLPKIGLPWYSILILDDCLNYHNISSLCSSASFFDRCTSQYCKWCKKC